MAWVTLGDALEAALASMMNEVGEGTIAVVPDATEKQTGAVERPGQVRVATQPAEAASPLNDRCEPTHPNAPPQRSVGSHLVLIVDNGPHFTRPHFLGAPVLRVLRCSQSTASTATPRTAPA